MKASIAAFSTKLSSPNKVSPSKGKQTKKKQKLPIKPLGKNAGDIRALFSTATKSTTSYTKLINDLGIQNSGSVPTKLINLLVDLTINNTSEKVRSCYICDNICNCKIFQRLRQVKPMTPSLKAFVSEPKLPDLDLIDNIDSESIRKWRIIEEENNNLAMNVSDIVNDHDVSHLDVDIKNGAKNFDLEFDFDAPIDLTSPENNEIKEENNNVSDRNFDLGDIEDIFADSSPEEGIAKGTTDLKENNSTDHKEALGFFGLDSIDDIFADSDESNCNQSPKRKVDESQSKIDVSQNKSREEQCVSPSILSGKVKITTSPILCSQVRNFNLSTKKNKPIKSSTPASNVKRRLIPETNYNTEAKSSAQNSIIDTTNKSMFTITQLVDMINKTDDKFPVNTSNVGQTRERSVSPILLSQADRKKTARAIEFMNKGHASQCLKESIIILDSDSDSNDNTQVYDVNNVNSKSVQNDAIEMNMEHIQKNPETSQGTYTKEFDMLHEKIETKVDEGKNPSTINTEPVKTPVTSKRKFSDDDDELNASPYFNKKPKLDEETKKLSLKEKVLKALKSDKFNMNFRNDNDVHFVKSPNKIISQKENKDPQFFAEKITPGEEEYIRKNNLEMLQMFRKDSKVPSPKSKFNLHLGTQSKKRKLNFDDSDDDFEDDNCYRSQMKKIDDQYENRRSKKDTKHKVRKVSTPNF